MSGETEKTVPKADSKEKSVENATVETAPKEQKVEKVSSTASKSKSNAKSTSTSKSDSKDANKGGSSSKSCFGCFGLGCLGILILMIMMVVGGYFLFRSTLDVDDFEGEANPQSYEDFLEKTGVDLGEVDEEDICFECEPLNYSGEKKHTVVITESETSSWFQHGANGLVEMQNTQMRFTEDQVELKSDIVYNDTVYAVYLSGNVERVSNKEVSVDIDAVKVGGFTLPAKISSYISQVLGDMANKQIEETDGFNIYKLEINDGEVVFEGTVPESVSY